MPNRAIEFHDSRLESFTSNGSTCVLNFSSAYIHESLGRPGWDVGSGWIQTARLHIADAEVRGTLGEIPCDLWHGELRLDGELFQMVPIPLEQSGSVQLDLEYMGSVRIFGTAIRLELLGESQYVEEFRGHPGR